MVAGVLSDLGQGNAARLGPVRPLLAPPPVTGTGDDLAAAVARGFGLDAEQVAAVLGRTGASPAAAPGVPAGITEPPRAAGPRRPDRPPVHRRPARPAGPGAHHPGASEPRAARRPDRRRTLMTPMTPLLTADLALKAVWTAIPAVTPAQPPQQAGLLPDGARSWLATLRLLSGVPFQHIVADERLLPPESIRFFYVDRAWTDALMQGALAVGAVTDADRALLQQLYPADPRRHRRGRAAGTGARGPGRGRHRRRAHRHASSARRRSSGWPGIHVNAYRAEVADNTEPANDPSPLQLMRLEQLAPSVLLAIFDGVPEIVHVDEPRHGVQFGVDETGGSGPGNWSYTLTVRRNAAVPPATSRRAPRPATSSRAVPRERPGRPGHERRSSRQIVEGSAATASASRVRLADDPASVPPGVRAVKRPCQLRQLFAADARHRRHPAMARIPTIVAARRSRPG